MSLQFKYSSFSLEAGTDEAGRGCLSGPVVAAAVILPVGFSHPMLDDSKKLTEKRRKILRSVIEENALCHGIGIVDEREIEELNILQASILAMHRAIANMSKEPEFIIVDGNRFHTYKEIPFETIVKGDAKYMSIAAASILAKTCRDEIMETIHDEFPNYKWSQNKGYPTKEHRKAIAEHGSCKYHRQTFKLLPS